MITFCSIILSLLFLQVINLKSMPNNMQIHSLVFSGFI